MMKFEKYPQKCPFCNSKVVYTSNKEIYGKEYGNGKVYLCRNCYAYTSVHNGTDIAKGVLANKEMRELKKQCHSIFDTLWKNNKNRNKLYGKLAEKMNISRSHCHFGHFDTEELKIALGILERGELNDM